MKKLLLVLSLLLVSGMVRAGTVYDAGQDLLASELSDGSETNPNGCWVYGTTPILGGAFSLLSDHSDAWLNDGLEGWYVAQSYSVPAVMVNVSSEVISFEGLALSQGQIIVHPGNSSLGVFENYVVVRWVAPEQGLADIVADWVYNNLVNTDVHILLNGSSIYNGSASSPQIQFENLAVLAGDTIDFVVGNQAGFYHASTGFAATVTLNEVAVPEPSLYLIAVLGVVFLIVKRCRYSFS